MFAYQSLLLLLSAVLLPRGETFPVIPTEVSTYTKNSQQRFFYQDLTTEIDKCLNISENGSKICTDLQYALNASTLVYYETDILLSHIDEVIPVIDLLLKHVADRNNLQISLGLRYLNATTAYLIDNRLEDVYFSSKTVFSDETKKKIASYVTSIVLTFFGRDGYSYNIHPTPSWIVKPRSPVVQNVEEFVRFHFGESFQLPVGVAFPLELAMYVYGWENNINPQFADFIILRTDMDVTSRDFSIHPQFINTSLENNEFTLKIRKMLKDPHKIRPITWMGNYKSSDLQTIPPYDYFRASQLPLYQWLLQSPSYNLTIRDFQPAWLEMCKKLFVDLQNDNNQNVIVPATTSGSKFEVVPTFKQTNMIGYLPDLQRNLSKLAGANRGVILNEETWGAIVRNSRQLWDAYECSESTPVNVIVDVTGGIQSYWNVIETYMKEILWTTSVDNLKISTVVFDGRDISQLQSIQSFVNDTKSLNITVGCSYAFTNSQFRGSSLRAIFEKNVCAPMFDTFTTFIWRIDGNILPHTVTYFDVFLSREIFLREFPDKKVILQFLRNQQNNEELNYA